VRRIAAATISSTDEYEQSTQVGKAGRNTCFRLTESLKHWLKAVKQHPQRVTAEPANELSNRQNWLFLKDFLDF
jgi:hypothetical protein